MDRKYSDYLCEWLKELGYTKCFYVAGGNIMHMLDSASKNFECIPFVHEVAAGIAAEYHNEISIIERDKAFVLVTAGPGLTNLVTAIAGSFLESRDLLVIGGQVKSSDLKMGGMRQRGIQEIDGVTLVQSITKRAIRLDSPLPKMQFIDVVKTGLGARKGPVFVEICLDVQAELVSEGVSSGGKQTNFLPSDQSGNTKLNLEKIASFLQTSSRPVLLIGGEISRAHSKELSHSFRNCKIPIMSTWNAADRLPFNQENFFGRPDTWGMRFSNVILQQSDLILALGARLSLQQTGFNYNEFVPNGKIVHIYSDESEFNKGLTNEILCILGNAGSYLEEILSMASKQDPRWHDWMEFCKGVKSELPLAEEHNKIFENFWSPYKFYLELSELLLSGDSLIPSSSGGSETVAMQSFKQKDDVRIITSSSLASMGYGLAGAIGAALSTKRRVCLVEGDGGFAQNMQELGTVERQKLNLKIFIFCNDGYASIRMTQRNYFGGNYLGCDKSTGLGLPNWGGLFGSFGIDWMTLDASERIEEQAGSLWESDGPAAFLVPIHPEQTYYPKIASRLLENGQMISNPLHEMTPYLDDNLRRKVMKYI